MSLKPIRSSRKRNRKARLEVGQGSWNWNWKPSNSFTPITRKWKVLAVLGIALAMLVIPAYGYYSNIYLPSFPNPSPSKYDPFTLLWNGTTTGVGPALLNSAIATCSEGWTTCSPSTVTVASGNLELVSVFIRDCSCAPTPVNIADSLGNSYSSAAGPFTSGGGNAGVHYQLFSSTITNPGSDTVTASTISGQGSIIMAFQYSGTTGLGAFTTNGATPNYPTTNVLSLTTTASLALSFETILTFNENASPCASYTANSGQMPESSQCFLTPPSSNDGLSAQVFQLGGLTPGTQSLSLTATGITNASPLFHFAIEVQGTGTSTCPAGYNCLFSSVNSADNIQLNAKPKGPSTLDSFHIQNAASRSLMASNNLTLTDVGVGETFTFTGNWQVNQVQFLMNSTLNANNWFGQITSQIFALTGTPGTNALPTGLALQTSASLTNSALSSYPALSIVTFTFSNPSVLNAGSYIVTVNATGVSTANANGPLPFVRLDQSGANPIYPGHNDVVAHSEHQIPGQSTIWDTADPSRALWFTVLGQASSSVALTNSPIDVSTSASKELLFYETWHNLTNIVANQPWGWYLTTNSTLPTQPNYTPLNDSSVVMANLVYPAGGASATKNYYSYQQKAGGQQLLAASGVGQNPYPSCPQTSTLYICDSGNAAYRSINFQSISTTLNYTGNGGDNKTYSLYCVDGTPGAGSPTSNPYCSNATQTPTLSACLGTTQEICASQVLPFLNINGGPFYLGFWSSAGQTGTIEFATSNTGTSDARANSVWYWVPNPTTATPATTESTSFIGFLGHVIGGAYNAAAGFLSPITAPILNAGNTLLSGVASAFIQAGNLLLQGLGVLAGFIVAGLNLVGNALGFGPIGTDLQLIFNQIISFFSNDVPTVLSNVPAIFGRFFDTLSIVFPWLPIALNIAATLLTLGIKSIVFIPTIVFWAFELVSTGYVIYFILFWFVYTGDDALGGALAFIETFEWLVFGIGIRYLTITLNFILDIATALIGLVPKPLIQAGAHAFPRIPIVEANARFVNPAFDLGEVRSGNMFSVFLWISGLLFLDWYESVTPALPGSIGALLPSAAPAIAVIAGFLPLLEIMTAFVGGAAFLMIPVKMLTIVGFDLQGLPVDVGPGRKISGGPGAISVSKGGKHFQGRLEKKIAERKGMAKIETQIKAQEPSAMGVG